MFETTQKLLKFAFGTLASLGTLFTATGCDEHAFHATKLEVPECCQKIQDAGDEPGFRECLKLYAETGLCALPPNDDFPGPSVMYGPEPVDPTPDPESCDFVNPYCETQEMAVECIDNKKVYSTCYFCEAYKKALYCYDAGNTIYGPPPAEVGEPCFGATSYCDAWQNAVHCEDGLVTKYEEGCYRGECSVDSAGNISCLKRTDFTEEELECCDNYSGEFESGFFRRCIDDLRQTGICQKTPLGG